MVNMTAKIRTIALIIALALGQQVHIESFQGHQVRNVNTPFLSGRTTRSFGNRISCYLYSKEQQPAQQHAQSRPARESRDQVGC